MMAHLYLHLLYEAIQNESAEVCLIFHNAHSMLRIENIILEIVLCIC